MATDEKVLPTIPLETEPIAPPDDSVAFLGDMYFNRAEAVELLKGEEKRFLEKAKLAEDVDGFRGATAQAEACAKVVDLVAKRNPDRSKPLDLAAAVQKERDKLSKRREGD